MYETIYTTLMKEIKQGKYPVGSRLPTEKELAQQHEVSLITSKKALNILAEKGLINRVPGIGNVVINHQINTINTAQSSKLIGIIMNHSSAFGIKILEGVIRQVDEWGLSVVVKYSFDNSEREDQILDQFLNIGVCGIIIMPCITEKCNPKLLGLISKGFPIIFVDRYLKELPASFVVTDNEEAAKNAMIYLFALGHEKVAVMSDLIEGTSTLEHRVKGINESYQDRQLLIDRSLWYTNIAESKGGGIIPIEERVINVMKHLEAHPEITAIFALKFDIACIAVEALKRLGKAVPKDYSVMCFDHPMFNIEGAFFTHVKQQELEMGKEAVDSLVLQLENPSSKKTIYLGSSIQEGLTTIKIKE